MVHEARQDQGARLPLSEGQKLYKKRIPIKIPTAVRSNIDININNSSFFKRATVLAFCVVGQTQYQKHHQ